jgi:P3 major capsid protein
MRSIAPHLMSSVAAQKPILSVAMTRNEYARMDAGNGQPTTAQIKAANLANRQAIVATALRRQQEIYNQSFNPTAGVTLNIQPRYAGLILGFFVTVIATMTLGTNNAVLTQFGPANLIQQVRFDDLSNNTRIQTTGWHLNAVNSAKLRQPFMACDTLTSYPIAYGNNFSSDIAVAPSTLTTAGGTAKMTFWVPLSYSEMDLRGAMWANVVNATANLQLTLATSAQAAVGATADPTSAVYQFDGTGATFAITNYNVIVHQVYYDQLPVDQKGNQILPIIDLSTLYMLTNTTLSGLTVNNDFPIPYANFRSFLSTVVIYDNQNAGVYPAMGSDISYWMLQTANFTNIFKYQPWFTGIYSRMAIQEDFPKGMYYFDSRAKPINTIQYGNQQLIINASTVNTNANLRVGWEMFAITNTLVGAASLAGGGA